VATRCIRYPDAFQNVVDGHRYKKLRDGTSARLKSCEMKRENPEIEICSGITRGWACVVMADEMSKALARG
jgi:hypothetical protein